MNTKLHKNVVLKASKVRTGGTLRGILNYILGLPDGLPVSITSDGFIIAGHAFLGGADNLTHNLKGFSEVAGFSIAEENHLWALARERVNDWRPQGECEYNSAYVEPKKPLFEVLN